MRRNFGIRQGANDYWNEGGSAREPRWPFYVIGAAVLLIIGIGIFIA
jgi:hypothetical protein